LVGVLKPKVKLICWSSNNEGLDPRRVILLAIKTSAGGVLRKGADYYLKDYPEEKLSEWIIKAVNFPSVLEHIYFTFLIEGISRVTSHQLVRHRIASYTQESQRYSAAERTYIVPKTMVKYGFESRFRELIDKLYRLYDEMIKSGIPYEDARYVLPQAVTTKILMTVNLRELIHIACLRLSPHAQWEIRELVKLMISEVSKIIPEIHDLVKEGCKRGV